MNELSSYISWFSSRSWPASFIVHSVGICFRVTSIINTAIQTHFSASNLNNRFTFVCNLEFCSSEAISSTILHQNFSQMFFTSYFDIAYQRSLAPFFSSVLQQRSAAPYLITSHHHQFTHALVTGGLPHDLEHCDLERFSTSDLSEVFIYDQRQMSSSESFAIPFADFK